MDIAALKKLPRAEQLAWADKHAGVAAGTLDGIWRTETNRGAHPTLIGPETKWGTAKGHFQFLDGTHAEMERRAGTPLDRFDFTESLVGAAELMKENKARYQDDAKAVMAYHGGTNQKNWGPKTKDYLKKVLGVDVPEATLSTRKVDPTGMSFEELKNLRGEDVARANLDGAGAKPARKGKDLEPEIPSRSVRTVGPDVSTYAPGAVAAGQTAMQTEETTRANTPFWGSVYNKDSTIGAAYGHIMQPAFNTLMTALGPPEARDSKHMDELAANWRTELVGFNDDERARLMDTSNRGEFDNEKFRIMEDRANSVVLNRSSMGTQLGAMFLTGALDPMTYLTGIAATKTFAMAGVGTVALAQAGRGGAALASYAGENILANVAYDASQQAMGAHRSVQDYAISAATGLLPFAIGARGVSKAATLSLHRNLLDEALRRQKVHIDEAVRVLGPDADPAEISRLATKFEADKLEADAAAARRPSPTADHIDAPDINALPPEAPATTAPVPDVADVPTVDLPPHINPPERAPGKPAERPDENTKEKEEQVAEPTPEPAKPVEEPAVAPEPAPVPEPRAPEPVPEPTPPAAPVVPTLPPELKGADPRYGRRKVEFDNDLDRAGYVVGATGKLSKKDGEFMKFIMDLTGMTEGEARIWGRSVRDAVKQAGKAAGDHNVAGESIKVPRVERNFDGHLPPATRPAGETPKLPVPYVPPAVTPETVRPTLPPDLARIKPNYGKRRIEFESDLDRAAYAIGKDGRKSKRDADLLDFVMTNTGLDEAAARAFGRKVAEAVKAAGKEAGDHNIDGPAVKVREQLREDTPPATKPEEVDPNDVPPPADNGTNELPTSDPTDISGPVLPTHAPWGQKATDPLVTPESIKGFDPDKVDPSTRSQLKAAGAVAQAYPTNTFANQAKALTDANLIKNGFSLTAEQAVGLKPGVHLPDNASPKLRNFAAALDNLREQFLPELGISLSNSTIKSATVKGAALPFSPTSAGILMNTSGTMSTLLHEFGHLVIMYRVNSINPLLAQDLVRTMDTFKKGSRTYLAKSVLLQRFGLDMANATNNQWDQALAAGRLPKTSGKHGSTFFDNMESVAGTSGAETFMKYLEKFDEIGAEQFVKFVQATHQGRILSNMSVPDQVSVYLARLYKTVKDLFDFSVKRDYIAPDTSWATFFEGVLTTHSNELKKQPVVPQGPPAPAPSKMIEAQSATQAASVVDPIDIKYGLDILPAITPRERAEKKAIREILRKAEDWDMNNPTDVAKVKTLMNNSVFNLATPGALLASSDQPLARMIAGTILEHAQGASGRRQTVAIRARTLQREFVGNSNILFQQHYSVWRNQQTGRIRGAANDLFKGELYDRFNKAVFMEQENRLWNNTLTTDPNVAAAADALTVGMERMRLAQKEAKTPGWGNLPATSRGYTPHSIDPNKYLATIGKDPELERQFRAVLKEQFMAIEDMDAGFADKVAGIYLGHARTNALGGGEIPANVHDPMAADYVRQAMKGAGMNQQEIDAFAKRLSAGAASHTKQRLKLDLTQTFTGADGKTYTLMDMFKTDQVALLRNQARRVSGEVALMGNGIAGSGGMELLRRALEFRNATGVDPKVRLREMEAFDQISAEILGKPFGQATPGWLDGVLTANATANLGGMGITQLGEYINVATGIGIDGALKAFANAPRMRAEVHALARGEKVENGILSSMELPDGGGEFGTANYKMVTIHDNPAAAFDGYGHNGIGPATRLLRATSYGLSQLSGHRLIHAVQTRGVAEQITLKAIRYIRDGGDSIALRDMGFDDATVAAIKADLPNMVEYGPNGGVAKFDLRKAKDQEAAARFVTAVHRGTAQLIQDSFVGEKGKWMHSGFGKVLSQFRNFPLLAVEKQWGRQRGNHGAAIASLMLLAGAGAVLPLVYARVALNAMNRPDRDEYIEKMTSPYALARATLNYVGMAGMAGDVMDLLSGTAQAVAPEAMQEYTGTTRTGRQASLGSLIPALGYGDELLQIPGQIGKGNPFAIAQTLPLSNVPWLVPLMNSLRPE